MVCRAFGGAPSSGTVLVTRTQSKGPRFGLLSRGKTTPAWHVLDGEVIEWTRRGLNGVVPNSGCSLAAVAM